jgi:hypothetical protein
MPFPIGDPEPRRIIEEGSYLGDVQRRQMLSSTAQKIFRLRADHQAAKG